MAKECPLDGKIYKGYFPRRVKVMTSKMTSILYGIQVQHHLPTDF